VAEMLRALCLVVVLGLTVSPTFAADTPLGFEDPAQQALFESLLEELRCLVCQNQSLADSHADLAQDLRDEVHRMVAAGENREAILCFMVERYGDFVLYRPPVKSTTWMLWLAPLMLLFGTGIAWWLTQRRAAVTHSVPLSEEEKARLARLTIEPQDDSRQH